MGVPENDTSAVELQRRIFTRWCNQKLELGKKPVIQDVVTDFADGCALVNLVEVLSEKTYAKKMIPTTSRIKQADQLSRALAFVKEDCGVKFLGVPASPENLMDGNELAVMGLIWSIMQAFLKFGDDEEEGNLSAEESLLMWAKNQLVGYPELKITNFTKSFHDGKAYAALIHKNRPKLIDPNNLSADSMANLEAVFVAATDYFDFERYLEPVDVMKLDSKSAFIFLSEFYYGIAKQRKVDLACKRITKLTDFTVKNDSMRSEYSSMADSLISLLDKVTVMLNDRTIDNTMAGAKAKIAEFQTYKSVDKLEIIDSFFSLESLYNQLSIRLSEHNRPQFEPGSRKSVPELHDELKQLETTEKERQLALVAELNRQFKLLQLNTQHETKHQKLVDWQNRNMENLSVKEVITSSGQAEYQINRLVNYNEECKNVRGTIHKELLSLGAELLSEQYEGSALVEQREAQVETTSSKMAEVAAQKELVLKDDLARMKVKEATDLIDLKFKAKLASIETWLGEKEAYLNKEEDINSIADAELQLSILDMYKGDATDMIEGNIASLKVVAQAILDAKYVSDLSEWSYPNPEHILEAKKMVEDKIVELQSLQEAKSSVLAASLEKELEKERLRLLFATQSSEFASFVDSEVERLRTTHFGFNLKEVEGFQSKLEENEKCRKETSTTKQEAYQQTQAACIAAGVTENVYSVHTLDDLAKLAECLQSAEETLKGQYLEELKKQREHDALCKKFADLADPFVTSLEANKDKVSETGKELDVQLALVQDLMSKEADLNSQSSVIEGVQQEMDAAGIVLNPYCPYTDKDISVQLAQYLKFFKRKELQLKEEIKQKELRGISPEQYEEIELQFKQFDKDESGVLSKNEFKSCLYSLGEDKTSSEIVTVMEQFGSVATGIDYKGFTEFMLAQLGDTDTREEILEGWELINKGASVALDEHMEKSSLTEKDIEYLHKTAPKSSDGGYDYTSWTLDVFSR